MLPIFEGDHFIGRFDAKADREKKVLRVLGLRWEPGAQATAARKRGLDCELELLAEFAGAVRVAGSIG